MENSSQNASTRLLEPKKGRRSGLNIVSVYAWLLSGFNSNEACMVCHIDTKASEKVSALILNKSFCQDVKKMSPKYQTSACEAFHSVVIHFAPKSTAFSYMGMLSRFVFNSF